LTFIIYPEVCFNDEYWSFYNILFQIFTEDIPEVETLPRDKVLDYLEKNSKELAISYLVCINKLLKQPIVIAKTVVFFTR
jgi:hypothetical protein